MRKNGLGHEPAEVQAAFVRQVLVERLDQLFLSPNRFLRPVLAAVGHAAGPADAVGAGDRHATLKAASAMRTAVKDLPCGLSPLSLLQELQLGPFPEEFADDPAVEAGKRAATAGRDAGVRDRHAKGLVPKNGGATFIDPGATRTGAIACDDASLQASSFGPLVTVA